ncbi:hypothetical protein H0H92_007283 [Tricholoma furcatifolium]|nr:hypothetical protein H0H92_007283 [Tricholoma furcatifolium]
MSDIITFYDIPFQNPGQAWSPNAWKARYSLNFKGIPYKTVWVEYPDIETLAKKLGVPPTSKRPDGTPLYTIPMIHDPSTNTVVADSFAIAEYLDKTYPDTPKLLPAGTRPLQSLFTNAFLATGTAFVQFGMPAVHKNLTSGSQSYFRYHKEKDFGKTMETWTPTGPARDAEWAKVRAGFTTIDSWLRCGKEDGPYFLGHTPAFVDFVVGARLMCMMQIFGEDSEEWADILTWDSGRWASFFEGLRPYETVV